MVIRIGCKARDLLSFLKLMPGRLLLDDGYPFFNPRHGKLVLQVAAGDGYGQRGQDSKSRLHIFSFMSSISYILMKSPVTQPKSSAGSCTAESDTKARAEG